MNIEEIEELERGDLVRDRVTGAVFKVCQVDDYNGLFEPEDGVIIPLSVEMVYKPDNVDVIYSGDHEDEKFEKVGDWDWIFLDMDSFRDAAANLDQADRYLTCEDLELTSIGAMERIVKPENVVSFKDESLIEMEIPEEVKELAVADKLESIIYPIEDARANKEKYHQLRLDVANLSIMIRDASVLGNTSVKIPADMDRIEVTSLFLKAGYRIGPGCICW